jgi:hypothetical protein
MKRSIAVGCALLLLSASPTLLARPTGEKVAPAVPRLLSGEVMRAEDFGAAGGIDSAALMSQLLNKWSKVMGSIKGWNEAAIQQFRVGYAGYPSSVLQQALEAETFEQMTATLDKFATLQTQNVMMKAFPAGGTRPQDADNPQVVEAKQLMAKTLGDDSRDLTFVPVTPCTVWDTRFATDPSSSGSIANGVTKLFYSHYNGAGGSYAQWGGNPSCPETAQNSLGGRPYAVMMTTYVNNATANGWVTLYRAGDPDPSQATISVYYSPGPTKTQTVISKSNRGWGTAPDYDIAATSRFATADVAASVVGYFMKAGVPAKQRLSFDGPAGLIAGSGTAFVFVGQTRTATVASTSTRLTGSITGVLGSALGTTADIGLCAQNQSGPGPVLVLPDFYTLQIPADRRAYNASSTFVGLAAGTYTVGFCVDNFASANPIATNDYVIGWMEIDN